MSEGAGAFRHGIKRFPADSRKIMKEVTITEFRVKCAYTLEQVRKTRKPIRITRFGEPMAEVVPPTPKPRRKSWLGNMAGSVKILGDIVGPTGSFEDWDSFRD